MKLNLPRSSPPPVSRLRSHPQLASYCPPGRLTILWSLANRIPNFPVITRLLFLLMR